MSTESSWNLAVMQVFLFVCLDVAVYCYLVKGTSNNYSLELYKHYQRNILAKHVFVLPHCILLLLLLLI